MTIMHARHAAFSHQSHRTERPDRNDESRIGSRIRPQPNGCWLYNGKADSYGASHVAGSSANRVRVHRFVYETLVGPIPDGHHLHHECETPGCCNPAHLIALSPAEHAQRHAEMKRQRGR